MSETERLGRAAGGIIAIEGCRLTVEEGPDAGAAVTIAGRAVTIGSGEGADLKLTDAAVSRSHAVVRAAAGGHEIEDLGSTNGTAVEGVRVRHALLDSGALIRIGRTAIRFVAAPHELALKPTRATALAGLVGKSPSMRGVYTLIGQVAPTEVPVVITGETGTGKEVAARAVHALSPRAAGPFVVFDCANVNRDILGSELFGHAKGAFTGAVGSHRGAFQRAHGGTVFLDEIGELPLDLQSRLLGVLQRREVQPLGAEEPVPVDARIVAATHRDLAAMVRAGTFREDLYFRLNVIVVDMPPLRARKGDLPLLCAHLLAAVAPPGRVPAVSPAAIAALERDPWRGNVRELANALQRALVLAAGGPLEPEHFAHRPTVSGAPAPAALEDVERQAIEVALKKVGGNKTQAARDLGIGLTTLKRKVREFGLE